MTSPSTFMSIIGCAAPALIATSLVGCGTSLHPLTADQIRAADPMTFGEQMDAYDGVLPNWKNEAGWQTPRHYRRALKAEALNRHPEWPEATCQHWLQVGVERGMPRAAVAITLGRPMNVRISRDPSGVWIRATHGPIYDITSGASTYCNVTYLNDEVHWFTMGDRW